MLRSHNTDTSSSILTARYHFSRIRRFYSNLILSATVTSTQAFRYKVPAIYFCPNSTKSGVSQQIFTKPLTSNVTESRQMGFRLQHGAKRTDGHDEQAPFRNCVNASKNTCLGKTQATMAEPPQHSIVKLYEIFYTVWLFRHNACIL